jgi:hypothetical protein
MYMSNFYLKIINLCIILSMNKLCIKRNKIISKINLNFIHSLMTGLKMSYQQKLWISYGN